MGTLRYDVLSTVDFDDRALAHLEVVITSKLRRNESFTLSWVKDIAVGSGRVTIWIHPSIPLVYEYSGNRPATINRKWLDLLVQSAGSAGGLRLVPEPSAE